MAHDVFISYSSKDQGPALAALSGLEAAGIRCWIAPRDVKPGAVWAQAIVDAIAECRVFVVVFSSNANRSGHIVNEVDAAVRKGATVVPFRIENVMPEGAMEYHLRTRHWLDALSPDLTAHVGELTATVSTLLAAAQPKPPMTEFMKAFTAPPTTDPAHPSPPKSRTSFETTDTGFHFKLPKPAIGPKTWRRGAFALVVLVAVTAWLARPKPVITGVPFEYRSTADGNEWSVRFTVDQIRFFEGPADPPRERTYDTNFTVGQTRYIHTEIVLRFGAPGRKLVLPVSCTIFASAGAVVGSYTIQNTIEPAATQWFNSRAWGAERPGTWKPGRYRVDCSYGDKLVGRGTFRVLG